MKKTAVAVLLCLTVSGCATIQHPAAPNVQYASVEQCQATHPESPNWCQKVMHQQATNQAVATTAVTIGVMAQIAYIIWVIVTLGR